MRLLNYIQLGSYRKKFFYENSFKKYIFLIKPAIYCQKIQYSKSSGRKKFHLYNLTYFIYFFDILSETWFPSEKIPLIQF